MEILTNSGRNRFNVLGAYSPDDGSLLSVEGTDPCDADMVKNILIKIKEANPSGTLLIVILEMLVTSILKG